MVGQVIDTWGIRAGRRTSESSVVQRSHPTLAICGVNVRSMQYEQPHSHRRVERIMGCGYMQRCQSFGVHLMDINLTVLDNAGDEFTTCELCSGRQME